MFVILVKQVSLFSVVSSAPADLATNIAESTAVSSVENISKQSTENKQDKSVSDHK